MDPQSKFQRKIINDPLYGFITISDPLIFNIIQHPYFQRLRRIQQLGLASLVYPGALHTRFHHALGAMHLTGLAIESLRSKGFEINADEARGVSIAILLHDIGHGPFSHALEHHIVKQVQHEEITLQFMHYLNQIFDNRLATAIAIFTNTYPKNFLHRLISGQLDMDRLDYLMRDSFYTGVNEGVISTDRILKMLTISDNELAVELKGIYSIEKFIVARRLMYWQVYFHKTVIAAEYMLISIVERARHLMRQGLLTEAGNPLANFLKNDVTIQNFEQSPETLEIFAALDDHDLWAAVKLWAGQPDKVLSMLCKSLINRDLFRVVITNEPMPEASVQRIKQSIAGKTGLNEDEADFLFGRDEITNNAYIPGIDRIAMVDKHGKVSDISELSEQMNIGIYSKTVSKYFTIYPKWAEPVS